jgi:hypothetical protein
MGVGVADAVEDGVVLEEKLEAADVLAQGEDQKQKAEAEGDFAPVMRAKSPARMQVMTARVSSQPVSNCQAGRVKR